MNTNHFPANTRSASRWLWLIAACALILSGCVSSTEVKSFVAQSNYEMLLSADPALGVAGLPANPSVDDSKQVDEAANRIENFLAQHPDDPAMVSALRLRQGLLYLNHDQFSLAESALGQVQLKDLHSARDKALYSVQTHLRWWKQTAKMGPAGFFREKSNAEQAMAALLTQTKAKDSIPPDLRDYFLEMRAWIGIKLGLVVTDPTAARNTLQDAVNPWAETFPTAEILLVESPDFKEGNAFDLSTRRVLRVRNLLTKLAHHIHDIEKAGKTPPAIQLDHPAFQKFYETQLRILNSS